MRTKAAAVFPIVVLCHVLGAHSDFFDSGDMAFPGNATNRSWSCLCNHALQPMCASNFITYGNLCAFDCAAEQDESLMVFYYGMCGRTLCRVDKYTQPVCGSDNRTYRSLCILKWVARRVRHLKLKHKGKCHPQFYYL